ncbi:MAG: HD domain-containing protein [Firmicutes bacterium]|nr:HD domain-containing protein [Bacillota bacterium]
MAGSEVTVRDPVHGDIVLTAGEAALLDTPEMQRLRGIRQLGAAYLVYPGAQHTRFEHSLGTLYWAERILAALERSGRAVSAEDRRAVRAAALLHDVSHIPFGHTFEDERALFGRHDRPERLARFLAWGELGRRLDAMPEGEAVRSLLTGRSRDWRREVVAGSLDADLLDYLRRDAYFCGLPKNYDDRVVRSFALVEGHLGLDLVRGGLEREDVRTEAVELLRLRYFLTERVYYHHAKLAAGAMVAKAVELTAEAEGLGEEDIYPLDDAGLLRRLRAGPPPARALVEAFSRRALVKRAYVLTAGGVGPEGQDALVRRYRELAPRRRAEEELARAAGLDPGEVIVHCPPPLPLKEAAVPVATLHGTFRLDAPGGGAGAEIASLKGLHEGLWKFTVFGPPAARARLAAAAGEWFGRPNEFRPPPG